MPTVIKNKKFLSTLKEKIIFGLVGLVFVFFTAYIKGCFNNTEAETGKAKNLNSGNGSQYNADRDVIINNNTPPENSKADSTLTKKTTPLIKATPTKVQPNNKPASQPPIINNGFINQGGANNTYNQTIKTKGQRHLSEDDKRFLITIPLDYSISIMCVMGDAETEIYAKEMVSFLQSAKYNATFNGWGMYTTQDFGKIGCEKVDSTKTVSCVVFSNPGD